MGAEGIRRLAGRVDKWQIGAWWGYQKTGRQGSEGIRWQGG